MEGGGWINVRNTCGTTLCPQLFSHRAVGQQQHGFEPCVERLDDASGTGERIVRWLLAMIRIEDRAAMDGHRQRMHRNRGVPFPHFDQWRERQGELRRDRDIREQATQSGKGTRDRHRE